MALVIMICAHVVTLIALPVFITVILLRYKSVKREVLVLFIFSVFIYVLGTMYEILATSLDAAVLGIFTRVLGGSLMLPLFLFFVQDYCELHLPKVVNVTIFITALLNIIIVWTNGWHGWFYSYLYLYQEGAAPSVRVWGFSYGFYYPFVFFIHPAICGFLIAGVVLIKIRLCHLDIFLYKKLLLGLFISTVPVTAQVLDYFQISFGGMYNTALVIPLTVGLAYFPIFKSGLHENEEAIRSRHWLNNMIANISHDIKTPLTILSLSIERLLYASPGDLNYTQNIQIAYKRNLDLQRLLQNLIDLTRIDASQNIYNPEWISLNTVLSDIQEKYSIYIESTGLYFDVTGFGCDMYIFADPANIWSIFDNIIYNAVRHTQEGGINITTQSSNDGIYIIVSDTGCGIAPEHLPRIFDRHYKAGLDRGAHSGETGIGLFIVKYIMENFNGKVEIKSEIGIGTSVLLFFKKLDGEITAQ